MFLAGASWVATKRTIFRSCAAFVMAASSAYALAFLVHMWLLAATGGVTSPSNVFWPSVTWFLVAAVCFVSAISTRGPAPALAAGFALIAAVSLLLAPPVHDFAIAVVLLLAGTCAFFFQRQRLSRRAETLGEAADGIFTASLGYAVSGLVLLYALAQIYAGFIGIQHHWGQGWAIAVVLVAFLFRFTLPLTIGAFLGALNVWGWHWLGALIFAAPGLAFMALMIPGALARAIGAFRGRAA